MKLIWFTCVCVCALLVFVVCTKTTTARGTSRKKKQSNNNQASANPCLKLKLKEECEALMDEVSMEAMCQFNEINEQCLLQCSQIQKKSKCAKRKKDCTFRDDKCVPLAGIIKKSPTASPSFSPTFSPSQAPSYTPTLKPTRPTRKPTNQPTARASRSPTSFPTVQEPGPTNLPTTLSPQQSDPCAKYSRKACVDLRQCAWSLNAGCVTTSWSCFNGWGRTFFFSFFSNIELKLAARTQRTTINATMGVQAARPRFARVDVSCCLLEYRLAKINHIAADCADCGQLEWRVQQQNNKR